MSHHVCPDCGVAWVGPLQCWLCEEWVFEVRCPIFANASSPAEENVAVPLIL